MNWRSHALLGKIAAESLPEWEKSLLAFPAEGPELTQLPECRNALDQMAASCLMMDWVYQKKYTPYCLHKDGTSLPHMLPDRDGKGAFFSGNNPDPGKFAEILKELMLRTLEAWKVKAFPDFMRFAGILGHYLQDVTAPSHTISGKMFRGMFPEPEIGKFTPFGKYIYSLADDISIPAPVCRWHSIDQAVFFLTQQAFAAAERARPLLPHLAAAAYRQDVSACKELLRKPAAEAAALTRDAWHTIFCIAENHTEAGPETLALTEIAPVYHHPDVYAYIGTNRFYIGSEIVPMKILGGGIGKGYGLRGYSGMKFFLNQVFDRLDFTLGMADDPGSFDEHIQVRFTVAYDKGWNSCFSEDMDYGGEILYEQMLGPGEQPRKISLSLPDAGTLIFAAKAVPYVNDTGKETFAVPHLAILEPILHFKEK